MLRLFVKSALDLQPRVLALLRLIGEIDAPDRSSPRVLYKGEPTGTLLEDNARVILERAEKVSKFG